MEAAGLAIGVASLAGLFSSCIDCYRSIQRGVALERDYKILQTKFDNQELRLYAWGAACGLTEVVQHYGHLDATEVRERVLATLGCIIDLFQDQEELKKRYGLKYSGQSSSSQAFQARIEDHGKKPRLGTFFRRKKQQRSRGLLGTVLWVIDDYRKFSELVQHLKDFNDDLESMTRVANIASRQRLVVEYEIEEIDDLETLEDVESAGLDDSDIVSDTASMRLASLREGSIRTIRSSSSIRDSGFLQTARSDLMTRLGSLRSTVSIDNISFQTTRSSIQSWEGSLESIDPVDICDSASFKSAHSELSARERLSIEFERDELFALGISPNDEQQQDYEEQLTSSVLRVTTPAGITDPTAISPTVEIEASAVKLPERTQSSGESANPDVSWNQNRKFGSRLNSTFKVLAIGPEGCNSTDLLTVFSLGYWPSAYRPGTFKDYVAECRVGQIPLKLLLVDTAGQQAYPSTSRLTYAGSDVVLLCFRADKSLTLAEAAIKQYVFEIDRVCPGVPKILVGVHDPEIELTVGNGQEKDRKQRREFAKRIGADEYMWCDPRRGHGVDDVFEKASRIIIRRYLPVPRKRSRISNFFRGLGVVVEDDEPTSP